MKPFCYVAMVMGLATVSVCHAETKPVRSEVTVKVLTWNIWMMPPLTFQSPSNVRRASAIAEVLDNQDADIVCLEKAFDGSARRIIRRRLERHYPYAYGPANDGFSIRTSSGVWVLSNMPLRNYEAIQFNKASNFIEWFSRKGAIALDGEKDGHRFRIIATHLAGEEGAYYTEKAQHARNAQLRQIAADLLNAPVKNVPVIIAGDFATPRYIGGDPGRGDTSTYDSTLALLGAENGPDYRVTLEDNQEINTLADSNSGRRDELDYILLRPNGSGISGQWELKIFQRRGWDKTLDRPDLSYRYAVEVIFSFPLAR
jgi:endonuclease/exonuclease/phosphatase family metal-dependent hydrolase